MKQFLKHVGYYAIFLLYYLICIGIISNTFIEPDKNQGVMLFFALAAIGSPIFIVSPLINKFYPRPNKKKHATSWGSLMIVLTALIIIGSYADKGTLNAFLIASLALNVCFIIASFSYKAKEISLNPIEPISI